MSAPLFSPFPTQTQTQTPTRPPNGGFFSPGSSPPLILAFLAIGAFFATMVLVFGWRKIRRGQRPASGLEGPSALSANNSATTLGTRPVLYECWVDEKQQIQGGDGHLDWRDIMPISAVAFLSESEATDGGEGRQSHQHARHHRSFHSLSPRRLLSRILALPPRQRAVRPSLSLSPIPSAGRQKDAEVDETEFVDGQEKRLEGVEVAVAIVMPGFSTSGDGEKGEGGDLPFHSIGTCYLPSKLRSDVLRSDKVSG